MSLADYYRTERPAYFTCPSCGGKKDYYSRVCRQCKKLKPSEYRHYPKTPSGALHVVVAEQALGRPLPEGAEVHHVNGCKGDARHSNLVICQDHAYHMLLHVRARVRAAGGDPNTQRICSYCKALTLFADMVQQGSDHPRGPVGTACKACARDRAKVRARARRAA